MSIRGPTRQIQASDIMSRRLFTVEPRTSLASAAKKMRQNNVGLLPILENGKVLGVVTDRDLATRAIAEGLNPNTTPVFSVMTRDAICCTKETELSGIANLMRDRAVRRVIVVSEDDKPIGVVSIDDIAHVANDVAGGTLEYINAR